MERRRLILHAGLGKSGSSAIQRFLSRQTDALEAAGIAYLGMRLERLAASPLDFTSAEELHRLLEAAPANRPAAQQRLASLIAAKAVARPECHTFIWSLIELATAADLMAPVIAALRDRFDCTVVLYFRHQADWLVSGYYQWGLKHKVYDGPVRSFEEFVPLLARRGADYRAVITGWRTAVGPERVVVRSYDESPDVVADFAAVAGIDAALIPAGPTRHYVTPDHLTHTLFKLYQGQGDAPALPGDLQALLSRHKLLDRSYRSVDPAVGLPTGAARQAWVHGFDEENAALDRDFGLKLHASAREPAADDPHPAPAAVVPMLLDLLIAMDARIARLEKQVKALSATPAQKA